jgi:hypothetical protein
MKRIPASVAPPAGYCGGGLFQDHDAAVLNTDESI